MRRMLSGLTAFGLLALGFAAPAVAAAPRRAATAADACNPAKPYPPAPQATVQVSTTTPQVGETINVSGIRYCPDEDVVITIAGKVVGTAHTDDHGRLDRTVAVPGPAGDDRVCGLGASGAARDRDCLGVHAQGGHTESGAGSQGDPAMTGVEIALLGVAALVLVVGGVVFTTLGRHRNPAGRG